MLVEWLSADVAPTLIAWLLTYLLHSTALLAGVWLLTSMPWASSDRFREAAWRAALVGGIVTSTVAMLAPPAGTGRSPLMPVIALPEIADVPDITGDRAAAVSDQAPLSETQPRQLIQRDPEDAHGVVTDASIPGTRADSPVQLRLSARAVLIVLGLLVVLVAAAGTLGVGLSWLRLFRQSRERQEIVAGPARAMLDELILATGIRYRVRLTTSPRILVPMALGLRAREICLPARAISDLSPASTRLVLAHELAHLLRRDPMWRMVAVLIERLLFVQPLNRVARRRLDELAEYQCDEWASTVTGEPLAMARCLADVASWLARSGEAHDDCGAPASAMARQSCVASRIERLLVSRPRQSRQRLGVVRPALVAIVATAGAMLPRVLPGTPDAVAERIGESMERVSGRTGVGPGRLEALLNELSIVREELTLAEETLRTLAEPTETADLPPILRSLMAEASRRVHDLRARCGSLEQEAHECASRDQTERSLPLANASDEFEPTTTSTEDLP